MSVLLEGVRVVRGSFVLEVDARLEAPCTAVVGASGSGKTTLLETLAGLVRPEHGRVVIGADVVDDGALHVHVPAWRRRIGYVPQDGALFPHLDVRGNLTYATRGGEPQGALAEAAWEALELVPLLGRRVGSLSGGEKRRVALGRALSAAPRLLLLDEPLAGLDRAREARAIDLLRRVRSGLAAHGVPLVLVTHEERQAEALADATLRLDEGRVKMGSGAISDAMLRRS